MKNSLIAKEVKKTSFLVFLKISLILKICLIKLFIAETVW